MHKEIEIDTANKFTSPLDIFSVLCTRQGNEWRNIP